MRLIVEDIGELIGWVVVEILLFLAIRRTERETSTAKRRVPAVERPLLGIHGRSLSVGRLLHHFGTVEFEEETFYLTVVVRNFELEDDAGVISVSIFVKHDAADGRLFWSSSPTATPRTKRWMGDEAPD